MWTKFSESESAILRLISGYSEDDIRTITASIRVRNAMSELYRAVEEYFHRYGLSRARFGIMVLLYDNPLGYPPSEIARRIGVTRGNLTGLVEKLESKRWILRVASKDRRSYVIRLTSSGEEMMKAFLPIHLQQTRLVYSKLNPRELEELEKGMNKLREGIDELEKAAG